MNRLNHYFKGDVMGLGYSNGNGAYIDDDAVYTREELKPYVDQRITVEGRIHKWGSYYDSDLRRNVPTALMKDIDIMEGPDRDKRFALISYVWVQYAAHIKERGAEVGDVVRLSCIVYKYRWRDPKDRNKNVMRYTLRDPVDVEVIRPLSDGYEQWFMNKPVVPVPLPPPVIAADPPSPPPAPTPIPEPASVAAPTAQESPRNDTRECFEVLMAAVDTFGLAKVEKTMKAIKLLQE